MHTTTPSCKPGVYAGTPENRRKRVCELPKPADGDLEKALREECTFLTFSQGSAEWFLLRRFRITGTTAGHIIREYARRVVVSDTGVKFVQADDGNPLLAGNEFEQILLPILKVLDKDNQLLVTRDFHDEKEKRETKYTEANLNLMRVSELKSK